MKTPMGMYDIYFYRDLQNTEETMQSRKFKTTAYTIFEILNNAWGFKGIVQAENKNNVESTGIRENVQSEISEYRNGAIDDILINSVGINDAEFLVIYF